MDPKKIETEILAELRTFDPGLVEREGLQIAETFALTFLGTFAVDSHALLGATDWSTARSILVAAATAGLAAAGRAARPAVAKAIKGLIAKKTAAPAAPQTPASK